MWKVLRVIIRLSRHRDYAHWLIQIQVYPDRLARSVLTGNDGSASYASWLGVYSMVCFISTCEKFNTCQKPQDYFIIFRTWSRKFFKDYFFFFFFRFDSFQCLGSASHIFLPIPNNQLEQMARWCTLSGEWKKAPRNAFLSYVHQTEWGRFNWLISWSTHNMLVINT